MKTCVRIKGKESLLLPGRLQESLEPTHRRRVAVVWGAGTAMAHRAVDAVLGPRKLEIEHTTAATSMHRPRPSKMFGSRVGGRMHASSSICCPRQVQRPRHCFSSLATGSNATLYIVTCFLRLVNLSIFIFFLRFDLKKQTNSFI